MNIYEFCFDVEFSGGPHDGFIWKDVCMMTAPLKIIKYGYLYEYVEKPLPDFEDCISGKTITGNYKPWYEFRGIKVDEKT